MSLRNFSPVAVILILVFAFWGCDSGGAFCDEDETSCDGECVNLDRDEDNCGDCGNSCDDDQKCEDGRCIDDGLDPDNPYANCGNDRVDIGEICDGSDLAGVSCVSMGFGPGPLACNESCSGFDRSRCGAPENCGDNVIQLPESCDGEALGGKSCIDLGYNEGLLACLPNCADFDVSACGPAIFCGNNRIEPGEVCDSMALGGKTCQHFGFPGGSLACKNDCSDFDRSGCQAPETCGNGRLDEGETCDGIFLGDAVCESLGFGPGTLSCMANCGEYDTSGCGPATNCGNGRIDPGEVCDGTNLNNNDCGDLGYWGGELSCAAGCLSFDDSACISECISECGDRECGPDPVCGQSCGDCDRFSVCGQDGMCEQICDLDAIEQNTVIDIDLKIVRVSGEITLNGARMPDNTREYYEDSSRGSVVLNDPATGQSIYISVGADGSARYSSEIFAGVYDISFNTSDDDYQDVLPYQNVKLAEKVEITSDRSLDYDLRTVTVSGTITLNGAGMPGNTQEYYEDSNRASLIFSDKNSGDALWVSLGASGPAVYSAEFYAGTYSIMLDAADDDYQNVLPYQKILLSEERNFERSDRFDYDLKTVVLDGTITLNGQRMPDNNREYYEESSRGSLLLTRKDTGDNIWLSIGAQGAARYSSKVFTGVYDIFFDATDDDYQDVLPYQKIRIAEAVERNEDTSRTYDLKTARLQGEVTLNGSRMPENSREYYEDSNRGTVVLRSESTSDAVYLSIGADGRGSYSATIFTDSYSVIFNATDDDYQNVLPYQDINLEKGLLVDGDKTKNYDLKTVTVRGELTLNGQRMPDNNREYYEDSNRGSIYFRNAGTGDRIYAQIGYSGPGRYSLVIFEDRYDILFTAGDDDYQDVLPYQEIQLSSADTLLGNELVRDFDLKAVMVSGAVTRNGQRMPDNTQEYYEDSNRGSVIFTDRMTGDSSYSAIGYSGPGTYELRIFSGIYNVHFQSGDDDYQNVLPYQKIGVRTGCFGADSCEHDASDISGTWFIITANGYWPSFTFDFVQQGEIVTGSFTNSQGNSGNVENGIRDGNSISFFFKIPYCPSDAFATVQTGCMMSGWFECATFTTWIGFRIE